MDTHIRCRYCHQVVGRFDDALREQGKVRQVYYPSAHCNGRHLLPTQRERIHCVGLVREVTIHYPETDTAECWSEYLGPANKFLVWVAILSTPGNLRVSGEPICWSLGSGFFGKGFGVLFAR